MKKIEWCIEYYSSGLFIKRTYVNAASRQDALKQIHASGEKVIEILRCVPVREIYKGNMDKGS